MKNITVACEEKNIKTVNEFVREVLEPHISEKKILRKLCMVTDELITNIVSYAYEGDYGEATVEVDIIEEENMVTMVFIDSGEPFNPLESEDPDTKLKTSERKPGGLGLYMVKNIMDEVKYEYKNNQNIVTVKKKL
ncbi:MAG: ATP-binding protein [Lachnospiraceae bacterium]|nr:ATP-binding protein [Lachnospiraceae bacterium]